MKILFCIHFNCILTFHLIACYTSISSLIDHQHVSEVSHQRVYSDYGLSPAEALCLYKEEATDFLFDVQIKESGCTIECIFLTSNITDYFDMSRKYRALEKDYTPCPSLEWGSGYLCLRGICTNDTQSLVRRTGITTPVPDMSFLGSLEVTVTNGSLNASGDDVDGSLPDPFLQIEANKIEESQVINDTLQPLFNFRSGFTQVLRNQEIKIRIMDKNQFFDRHLCLMKFTPSYLVANGLNSKMSVYNLTGIPSCKIAANITWTNNFR